MIKKIVITIASLFVVACSSNQITLDGVEPPVREAKGDGYVFLEFLEHKNNSFYLKPLPDNKLEIIFRGKKNDIEHVYLYYNDVEYEMESLGSIGEVEYFEKEVEGDGKYYFKIEDGKFEYYYGEQGSYTKEGIKENNYKFDKTIEADNELMGKVWYQIYIDGFNNGNKENDPLFNEFGPESYIKPNGKFPDGIIPLDSVSDVWGDRRDKNNLGSFSINSWTDDFNRELLWEKKANKLYPWSGKATKRFGGDLQGIESKLVYLSDLGVDGLWLSPIMYSYSGNKNDVIDYRHISPDFGTINTSKNIDNEYKLLSIDSYGKNILGEDLNPETWKLTESDEIFENFVKELKEKNMKLMVELNFDYVSDRFFAFEALLMKGPKSKYLDWFFINNWKDVDDKNIDDWNPLLSYEGSSQISIKYENGKKYRRSFVEVKEEYTPAEKRELINWNKSNLNYEGYKGNKSIVKLNLKNEEVKKYLYASTEKFVEMGIDAYSITYSQKNQEFYKGYKNYLENKYKGFKLVYHINANEKIGTENVAKNSYEVGDILYRFLLGGGSSRFYNNREVEVAFNLLKKSSESDITFNMLESFDTDRFSSMLLNKNRDYDMFNKQDRNSYLGIKPDLLDETIKEKVKLATIAQYTLPGSPVIYYGDEKFMWGGDLPHNRKAMLWEEKLPYVMESDGLEKYSEYKGPLTENAIFDEVTKKIRYKVSIDSEMGKFYKKINEIYSEYRELFTKGKFDIVPNESKLAIYKRTYNEQNLIVALNNTDKKVLVEQKVESGKKYINLFTDKEVEVISNSVEIEVEAYSGLILMEKVD